MVMDSTLKVEKETEAETRLWQAVILSAVEDWMSGVLRTKQQAEAYLFDDNTDFPLVCESAGMNVDRLRSQLKRMKDQSAAGVSRN